MITDTHIFASLSTRLFAVGSKAGAFQVGFGGERGRDEKSGWMSWVSPCAPYQPQFQTRTRLAPIILDAYPENASVSRVRIPFLFRVRFPFGLCDDMSPSGLRPGVWILRGPGRR